MKITSKIKTLTIMMALSCSAIAQAESSPCDKVDTFPSLVAAGKYRQAFDGFLSITGYQNNQFCFGNQQQTNNAISRIVVPWGDKIFADIFQNQTITFNAEQTKRLQEKAPVIKYVMTNVQDLDNTANWRFSFLNAVLDLTEEGAPDTLKTPEMYQRLTDVVAGWHREKDKKEVAQYNLPEFVGRLLELRALNHPPVTPTRSIDGKSPEDLVFNARMVYVSNSTDQGTGVKTISPVRFHFDSTSLNDDGRQEMNKNINRFRSNTVINHPNGITIIGHTDTKGDAAYNCWLSQCRVNAIKRQLISEGFSADKITVGWAGENVELLDDAELGSLARTLIITKPDGEEDIMRRRVEFEVGGSDTLRRYRREGKLCEVSTGYANRPCPN